MQPPSAASIYAPFIALSRESRELYLPRHVARIPASALSPLAFLRDFVSANLPLVITEATEHWPALTRWRSDEYLRQRMEGREVTVALTPNGRADSLLADGRFVLPLEERWPFASLLSRLSSTASGPGSDEGVAYCQHQNDSLSREFSPLSEDVLLPLPFASLAFSSPPDAVNVWIGSADSLSSLHHDHYENVSLSGLLRARPSLLPLSPADAPLCPLQLYCVVRGVKQVCTEPPAWPLLLAAAAADSLTCAVPAVSAHRPVLAGRAREAGRAVEEAAGRGRGQGVGGGDTADGAARALAGRRGGRAEGAAEAGGRGGGRRGGGAARCRSRQRRAGRRDGRRAAHPSQPAQAARQVRHSETPPAAALAACCSSFLAPSPVSSSLLSGRCTSRCLPAMSCTCRRCGFTLSRSAATRALTAPRLPSSQSTAGTT